MPRQHRMPFGAEVAPDGVHFRLWAPASARVDLLLFNLRGDAVDAVLPMAAQADGWYALTVPVAAGQRYKYRIDGRQEVPDPASRFNPQDVEQPCEVIDPAAFAWRDGDWRGRPWHEAVIYQLHVGTFTPQGTFRAAQQRLPHLKELGVTFIQLLPVAEFPGQRSWGYDGVLQYAPDAAYGRPEDLKALIDAAHAIGIGVLLDVVYNHFGPQGNYLHHYAPQFFSNRYRTPWGEAIDFEGRPEVRAFFIHNALYWFEEFHFDGLRIDAVHALHDAGPEHILTELARAVREGPGATRHVHLVLENHDNEPVFLERFEGRPRLCDAQWNEDLHHSLHVLLTGESQGYYADFAERPHAHLQRCIEQGFAFQGEVSRYRRGPRGKPSAHLPPTAFVSYLQNHDEVGNRHRGERLAQLAPAPALQAAQALVLLMPSPPMLFMGEEWGAPEPFLFFCDFEPELAARVREGRRRHLERVATSRDGRVGHDMPEPDDPLAFTRSRLDWTCLGRPGHAAVLDRYRQLLALRAGHVVALIPRIATCRVEALGDGRAFLARWQSEQDAPLLEVVANLDDGPCAQAPVQVGRTLFRTHGPAADAGGLPAWSVHWRLPA